jgi:hypothetical protein
MSIGIRVTCIVLAALACLTASSVRADILPPTGWGDAISISDPAGDQAEGSRDILGLFYKLEGGVHYFRMDIAEAPVQVGGQFAAEYFLQIDSMPGGGNAADTSYIAESLLGIDTLIGSHYTVAGGFVMAHRHNFTGGAPPAVDTAMFPSIGGLTDYDEDGGKTLQWAIPVSELYPAPFTVYGSTMDISVPSTFDVTSGLTVAAVPEPTSMGLLLTAAVFGLAAGRRRNR